MTAKPQTIDEYLSKLPHHQRATLEKLRVAIRAALPEAEEAINYGMPSFRIGGKVICGFAAAKRHCAFYPWSSQTVATLAHDLEQYETSKGTIRFPIGRPLPAPLVRKVIKTRLAEIAAPASERAAPSAKGAKEKQKAAPSAAATGRTPRPKLGSKPPRRPEESSERAGPKRARNRGRQLEDEIDFDR
jgi:uncharacterized protein YdhG (YjbR/CyaY superfamily)